jgi:hypothetical protein
METSTKKSWSTPVPPRAGRRGRASAGREDTEAPRDGERVACEVTEIPPPCRGGRTRRCHAMASGRRARSRRSGDREKRLDRLDRGDREIAACVGSVAADPRRGEEADPREGRKKADEILVLLSFFYDPID